MKLDLFTLIVVQYITFTIQAIVLFIQHRTNRAYHGTGWWVAGVSAMALGGALMPFVYSPSLLLIAALANPLMVLAQVFLYVGMLRYWGKREKPLRIALTYAAFLLVYFYFIFADYNLSVRTILVNAILAVISILTATVLINRKNRKMTSIEGLVTFAFLSYALFLIARAVGALVFPPMQSYDDQRFGLEMAFIVPIIVSALWTYGFIILINQRLNREVLLEKEKMQNVFNTGPDAVIISRLSDGSMVDVNERFSAMTGYTREESIGKTTLELGFWGDPVERECFLAELKRNGFCESMDFVFGRRDGSRFDGAISARTLLIHEIPHAVSLVRDMTTIKQSEEKIQQLVRQLETQRNAAEHNSLTDSLTGLSNRRYFDEALKLEFSRMNRSGSVLSLIMLDVDFFKSYNDHYGHVAGDECLRRMAEAFRKIIVRTTDVVARYGGEEFVIILPNTDAAGANQLAERIREVVEALRIPHEPSTVSRVVTISLGVVTTSPMRLETPEQLVGLVDAAMYRAKAKGRNRVEKAIQEVSPM